MSKTRIPDISLRRRKNYLLSLDYWVDCVLNRFDPVDGIEQELLNLPILPVRVVQIKTNGKIRTLGIPAPELKPLLRELGLYLYHSHLDYLSPNSMGGIPGKSIADALAIVVKAYQSGKVWVLRLDIENAFPNVRHRVLRAAWNRAGITPDLITQLIMRKIVKAPLSTSPEKTVRGLHTGLSIAPILFNILMTPFDKFCSKNGFEYYRWLDDVAIFFPSKRKAIEAQALVQRFVHERLHLPLNTSKTRVSHMIGIELLGHSFQIDPETQKLVILPSQKNIDKMLGKVEDILNNFAHHKNFDLLLIRLNEYLADWSRAFSTTTSNATSKRIFNKLDILIYSKTLDTIQRVFRRNKPTRCLCYDKLLGEYVGAKPPQTYREAKTMITRLLFAGKEPSIVSLFNALQSTPYRSSFPEVTGTLLSPAKRRA